MLVLTRKERERIRIGEDVEVVVVKARRGSVSLGVIADGRIKILRGELVDTEGHEGKEAA